MRLNTFSRLATTTALFAGAYAFWLRPWLLSWGATEDETEEPLPGDDIVADPRVKATRAITIDAPAAAVWPWLVQIGQGRGGLYSYDWLENLLSLNIHSADTIIPEYQTLKVGDMVRLVPEGTEPDLAFEVAILKPEMALVLRSPGEQQDSFEAGMPFATWAFILNELDDQTTRLIARFRSDYKPDIAGVIGNQVALEPLHFMMERKMLLGIKERVEAVDVEVQTA